MSDHIVELADAIYREKVERARRRPIEEKILDGCELFAYACEITKAGIRHQNPEFSEEQVRAELRRRLELGRRLGMLDSEARR
jgi:hypothetical protein